MTFEPDTRGEVGGAGTRTVDNGEQPIDRLGTRLRLRHARIYK